MGIVIGILGTSYTDILSYGDAEAGDKTISLKIAKQLEITVNNGDKLL